MSDILKVKSDRWWVSSDQKFIETCYMVDVFGSYYGYDEKYWSNMAKIVATINEMDLSDKLVLPFVHAVGGVKTVVLMSFDIDKTDILAPYRIDDYKDGIYDVVLRRK